MERIIQRLLGLALVLALLAMPGVTAVALPGLREAVQGEHVYVAQTASGSDSGVDCANAHALDWFSAAANWTTTEASDGLVGPGDTVHLCGTFTGTAGQTILTIPGS